MLRGWALAMGWQTRPPAWRISVKGEQRSNVWEERS
jgi:hypothetical protein